jgi:soluble lytic murein transglycosylase-like protein
MTWVESHFNSRALSSKGARGLMQVLRNTKKGVLKSMRKNKIGLEIHERVDLHRNKKRLVLDFINLEVGAYYLKRLIRRFKRLDYATVAYNMGPTWTQKMLNRKIPIGTKRNRYLRKIRRAYLTLMKTFQRESKYVTKNTWKTLKMLSPSMDHRGVENQLLPN